MKNIFLPLLLLISIAACQQKEEPAAKKLHIKSQAMIISDSVLNFRAEVYYPRIDSVETDWEKKLNKQFYQEVITDLDSFRQFIGDFEPDMLRELDGSFAVHTNDGHLLSISQRFIWAVPGTSILLGEVKCSNFDRHTEQEMSLKDCFRTDDYADKLVNWVNAEVEKQYGIEVCRQVKKEDLELFSLDKTGIRFFLDIYSGIPSCQQVEIVIPFEQMDAILAAKLRN